MLNELIEQIERKASEHLPKKKSSHVSGIQISGTSFSRTIPPENLGTWRSQIDRYLDLLAEREIGLLITIDEITPRVPELVSFISTFQTFVMEKRNVALLMAGLPGNVHQLLSKDSISFLRRAFHRELKPVSIPDTRTTLKRTIALAEREITKETLDYTAEKTAGFPYLIQLIGYHMFNQSSQKIIPLEDAITGVNDAHEDMRSAILEATLADLSDTDIAFLRAMLPDHLPSRTSVIAQRMNISPSQASHYKRRLVLQGVIAECGRGLVEFSMPMLKSLLDDTQSPLSA